jgi:hypothetical protein
MAAKDDVHYSKIFGDSMEGYEIYIDKIPSNISKIKVANCW